MITTAPYSLNVFAADAVQLLGEKYNTLWLPRPRAAYMVRDRAFQANGFSVEIADVKDNAEQQRHRGVIVSVSAPTLPRPRDSVLSDEKLLQSKIEARTHGLLSIASVWQVFEIRGASQKFAKEAAEVPERCDFEEAELWREALRYTGS
ncbi:hypothetical protein BJ546DRAFT_1057496 [Cryomyces antarcticus]